MFSVAGLYPHADESGSDCYGNLLVQTPENLLSCGFPCFQSIHKVKRIRYDKICYLLGLQNLYLSPVAIWIPDGIGDLPIKQYPNVCRCAVSRADYLDLAQRSKVRQSGLPPHACALRNASLITFSHGQGCEITCQFTKTKSHEEPYPCRCTQPTV